MKEIIINVFEDRCLLIEVCSFIILIVIDRVEPTKSWPCYWSSSFNNYIDLRKINQSFIEVQLLPNGYKVTLQRNLLPAFFFVTNEWAPYFIILPNE